MGLRSLPVSSSRPRGNLGADVRLTLTSLHCTKYLKYLFSPLVSLCECLRLPAKMSATPPVRVGWWRRRKEQKVCRKKCFPHAAAKDLQTAALRSDLGHESRGCRNGTLRLNNSPSPNPINILPFTPLSPRPFPLICLVGETRCPVNSLSPGGPAAAFRRGHTQGQSEKQWTERGAVGSTYITPPHPTQPPSHPPTAVPDDVIGSSRSPV